MAKIDVLLRKPVEPAPLSSRPELSNMQISVSVLNLIIDFGKFKDTLLTSLEAKKRPSASDRVHMVQILSQDIFEKYEEVKKLTPSMTQKSPGRAVYMAVIDSLFETFAFAFEDRINGKLVRDGKYTLREQIETCVENKYRPKQCPGERAALPAKGNRSASCILPEKFAPPLTKRKKDKAEEIRRELLTLYKASQSDWEWGHIKEQLAEEASLAAQRAMINSKNRYMGHIVEKWPFLFEVSGMLCHLDSITGSSLIGNFERFIDEDLSCLLQFLTIMSPQRIKNLKIERELTVGTGSLVHRQLLGAMCMLAVHWGEEPNILISCVEVIMHTFFKNMYLYSLIS